MTFEQGKLYPLPDNYGDLKAWAKALISELESVTEIRAVTLPVYPTAAKAPSPTRDGLLVLIDGTLNYSSGGSWIAVADAP